MQISFSNFILEFSDFHVSGYQQLCSKFFSASAVAVQGINENYWLCVTTALFTNKAQMNKVLVQLLLVNMLAFLHFWKVSRLPLQVLSCMSSKFYCRSGWSEYFQVHSTSLRRGKTTWTLLGRRPLVRHGQHAARLGIRWLSSRPGLSGRLCTSMRLGAAWRLIAGSLCMVPVLPAWPRCPRLPVRDVTCHYMMIHYMKLHAITSFTCM